MDAPPKRSMMFWKKDKKDNKNAMSMADISRMDPDAFEGKDVGMFSMFVPFVKNYASSMSKTRFPYKPIISLLGETAQYSSPYNGSSDRSDKTYVLAENLRKDPPYSCFYITNPRHGVSHEGTVDLAPKFKQAHIHVLFKGQNKTTLTHPDGLFKEEFYSDIPDLVIRLLRMHTELAGEVNVTSSSGFVAKISFKEKALFNKAKNVITGKISTDSVDLYTIEGSWDDIIYLNDLNTGQKIEFLNRTTLRKNCLEALPLELQPRTSCDRIWGEMLEALMRQDFNTATALKSQINAEELSLLNGQYTSGNNLEYISKYFHKNAAGLWEMKDPNLAINMGNEFHTLSGLPQV